MKLHRAAAAVLLVVATSAAQSQVVVINEGFGNVATLAAGGWVLNNASTPLGTTGWFQGDQTQFASHAGPAAAYIAANFNNAGPGGTIADYLISPLFSTALGGTVSFWARAADDPAYSDHIAFGLSTGGGTNPATFSLGAPLELGAAWTRYSFTFAPQGIGATGRAVVEYLGVADTSNYVGVDSFNVNVVPEPETWALFGLGLAGLGAWTRRHKAVG
ncbi:MAG: choice-of-anchor J domain-containing protein [Caldimonas sp.]